MDHRSCSKSMAIAMQAMFDAKLESGMQALMESKTPCLCLGWLQQALELLREAHKAMEALVPDMSEALRSQDLDWLRNCVSSLESQLRACATLRKSIHDIRYYEMFLQLGLQALDRKQRLRAKDFLASCIDSDRPRSPSGDEREVSRLGLQKARLEACQKSLLVMLGFGEVDEMTPPPFQYQVASDSSEIFFSALYGIRVSAIFVLLVIAFCLTVKPSPIPQPPPLPPSSKPSDREEPSWWPALCKLRSRVREEIAGMNAKGAFALLHELDVVDERARKLHGLLQLEGAEEEGECAAELKRCVEEVEAGLMLVEAHINEIIKVLSSSRTLVYQLLGDKHAERSPLLQQHRQKS